MRHSRITIIAALTAGVALLTAAGKGANQSLLMQETLASFRILLPLSLSKDEFQNKKNKELIEKHLQHLSKSATKVFSHFSSEHDERSFVARSLAHDAREALNFYQMKNYDGARFILHHISENCVSCHSKLPAKSQKHSVKRLFGELKDHNIKGLDLAHYLVMTRKFEPAAKTYEKAFLATPSTLASKSFGEYLKIRIRVLQDIDGVISFLDKVAEKKLDDRLSKKVSVWRASATDIKEQNALNKISITLAEKLVAKGQALQDFPQDNRGTVYFVASSAIVQTLIDSKKTPKNQRTEAYYLAGTIESHLSQSIWINEIEHFFELAITSDPKSKWARLALKKLEDEYIIGYSGSSGTNLPDDIKKNLNRLKKLVK